MKQWEYFDKHNGIEVWSPSGNFTGKLEFSEKDIKPWFSGEISKVGPDLYHLKTWTICRLYRVVEIEDNKKP